ncbi:MAG: hypothetical protein BECKG1743F_GA0114225_109034, partial [Candidatus Kentron sp. G]
MGECLVASTRGEHKVRPYAPPNVGANLVFAHYARFALRHPTRNNLPKLRSLDHIKPCSASR